MTAREDQSETVVGDPAHVAFISFERLELGEPRERVGPLGERALASEAVDRAVASRRRDPRAGVPRHTATRPGAERLGERLLDGVLRQVEVAEDPDQGRDRSTLLLPEQAVDDLARIRSYDGASNSMIGRTSTDPRLTLGIFDAASIA